MDLEPKKPETQLIDFSIKPNGVAVVNINRADKANALTIDMWKEINDVFNYLSSSDDVRVILFKGNGKNFSAGIDLMDASEKMFGKIVASEKEAGRKGIWLRKETFIAFV